VEDVCLEVEGLAVEQSRSDSIPCGDETPQLDAVNLGNSLNCGKEKLCSLLWEWRGFFEKAFRELDRALRLAGLGKIGPRIRPHWD
jgi:hypothetical protein